MRRHLSSKARAGSNQQRIFILAELFNLCNRVSIHARYRRTTGHPLGKITIPISDPGLSSDVHHGT
jgi:hypothetical protein